MRYDIYDRMPGPGEIVVGSPSAGSVQTAQSVQALANTFLGSQFGQLSSPLMQQAAQQSPYYGMPASQMNEMMRMEMGRRQGKSLGLELAEIQLREQQMEINKNYLNTRREQLEKYIYDIEPTENPFQTKLVKRKITIRDELQAETNKWLEGALH